MMRSSEPPHQPGTCLNLETKGRPEKRHIQSIEIGFRLIRVLADAGSKLPLKTLSARADMPPGKAHLYLVSFMRIGLVVQDAITMHYGLGPYALQLGVAALQQISLPDLAPALAWRISRTASGAKGFIP